MKEATFRARLQAAPRGDWVCYHVGLLMRDRQDDAELSKTANAAWDASEAGVCMLVQQRRVISGRQVCEYMAVKL